MRSFIACHIPDGRSRVQIGFDPISSSASSTRDMGTRIFAHQCNTHATLFAQQCWELLRPFARSYSVTLQINPRSRSHGAGRIFDRLKSLTGHCSHGIV